MRAVRFGSYSIAATFAGIVNFSRRKMKVLLIFITVVHWAHGLARKSPPFSWLWHGLWALPLIALVHWQPWTASGAAFAWREGEQVAFEIAGGVKSDWLDHVMDVLVPGFLGWLLLR